MSDNKKIQIKSSFWRYYRELVRKEMIPYQWRVLNDEADITIEKERNDDFIPNQKSHAIENFKIAAGLSKGHHYGWVFQDSDVYKWLEAVAYSLMETPDALLQKKADEIVELICMAQEADGYLSTYFTLEEPERRLKRLSESHELYCAGHYMEAAVAYHEATGNQRVLQSACKLADFLCGYFGEGKHFGYDGHEEVEIGLMKLFHLTGEKRYLELAGYFLDVRGTREKYFEEERRQDTGKKPLIAGMEKFPASYFQTHKPVRQQESAEGHAVRLAYLCTAMAEAARQKKDKMLFEACKRLWENMTSKRMYVTGGIGSTVIGEAFTFDYDLPNDTMYCETCASVALVFWGQQMLAYEADGAYADVMERALFNTALAGMALDGKHFFYVNPLEANPEASRKDPGKSHVKCVRPQWLGCACCPPNLARLLASLDRYLYLVKGNMIYANLFAASEGNFETVKGRVKVTQETDYPWDGGVRFLIEPEEGVSDVSFAVRIPGWSSSYSVLINGRECQGKIMNGYWIQEGICETISIELKLPMEIQLWEANPLVRADMGKAVLTRGPLVYCMEEVDNGKNLHTLLIKKNSEFHYSYEKDVLNGVGMITAAGKRERIPKEAPLYHKISKKQYEQVEIKWIPYYSWANRGENEMQVWFRTED